MEKRLFCYVCGSKVEPKSHESVHCPVCDQLYYINPKPCVELAIWNDQNQILLCKRAYDPGKGQYDLPGGFIDIGDKTIEHALWREMQEELGLSEDDVTDLSYVGSYNGTYAWGGEQHPIIISAFTARLKPNIAPDPKDDVEEIIWLDMNKLDDWNMSLPASRAIIRRAYEIIQL